MELTKRQKIVLKALAKATDKAIKDGMSPFMPPAAIGGENRSFHSAALRSLVPLGLVEDRERGGKHRVSYVYAITTKGRKTLEAIR